MKEQPIVSLCMPTNGISEWVFPVLDSIYMQEVEDKLFEVIITDNGHNVDFKLKMKKYLENHINIIYAETDALPFLNEIESYKRANGELIKFVNHRTMLVNGALQKLLDFTNDNRKSKPVVYYSNGVLKMSKGQHIYDSFDQFVRNLSYWSSWSTGMTIWKSDFVKLPGTLSDFNELYPHTTVLFNERERGQYVIDNTVIFNELSPEKKAKGDYDLFGAFGIEYPGLISDLLRDGSITSDTYRYVADKNLEFIANLYWDYCIKKKYCSYDLSGLNNCLGIYYTRTDLNRKITQNLLKKIVKRIYKKLNWGEK